MNNSVIKIINKDKASIIIDIHQPSHSLSVGKVVYYSKPDKSYGMYKEASAATLETANAIGFVYSVADKDNFKLITNGMFENIIFKNYNVGETIYLSKLPGMTTNAEQVYSKPLGVKTKDGLLINIQRGSVDTSLLNDSSQDNNGFITSSGGAASETTITQENHGLSVGDVIYSSKDGYKKALATEYETVEVVGIVSTMISKDAFTLLTSGFYKTKIFDKYLDGTVLYLSLETEGALTNIEDYISKPIAIKVKDGIVIDIQRGILYNAIDDDGDLLWYYKSSDRIGDIKYSLDTTPVRKDGYVLFQEDYEYNKAQLKELLDNITEFFLDNYVIINEDTISFKNTESFIESISYDIGYNKASNIYIKAFEGNNEISEGHQHNNKKIIDSLSESKEGLLEYKGKIIESSTKGSSSSNDNYINKTTLFKEDGTIIEKTDTQTEETVFNPDGSITVLLKDIDNNVLKTKQIIFNPDGSITEVIE